MSHILIIFFGNGVNTLQVRKDINIQFIHPTANLSASWEAQIEIENPAPDWEKEYSRYINRWYSLDNVNIYILFIDSLFYLYPRE